MEVILIERPAAVGQLVQGQPLQGLADGRLGGGTAAPLGDHLLAGRARSGRRNRRARSPSAVAANGINTHDAGADDVRDDRGAALTAAGAGRRRQRHGRPFRTPETPTAAFGSTGPGTLTSSMRSTL